MGNQSNNDTDRPGQQQQPRSNPPGQRDDQQKPEKRLGDDPDSEGKDNESLPEGSNPSRDQNPTQQRAEERLDNEPNEGNATAGVQRRKAAPSDFFNGA